LEQEAPIMSDSARLSILARIREALSVKTSDEFLHSKHDPAPVNPRVCLPPGGSSPAERLEHFQRNLALLKAEFVHFANLAEASAWLHVKALGMGWRKIACHAGPLSLELATGTGLPMLVASSGYAIADLEACPAGITECDALVAQTGSVLVSSASAGGRALSVLPPHHVVVARTAQLVEDMTAAFEVLEQRHGSALPSFISFITGASRTGDIERILVLGAHGPRQLTVIMVDSIEPPIPVDME
jgi:L-lactate dehydrogenase complex protein LldG